MESKYSDSGLLIGLKLGIKKKKVEIKWKLNGTSRLKTSLSQKNIFVVKSNKADPDCNPNKKQSSHLSRLLPYYV